jgi:hypothetical protein
MDLLIENGLNIVGAEDLLSVQNQLRKLSKVVCSY